MTDKKISNTELESESAPLGLFDTHKFLYTLNYEKNAKGHKIIFTNKKGKKETIILEKIEIGTSPVSCKLHDTNGKRHIVPFYSIQFIYKGDELVWEGSTENKKVKIIKGHKSND